MILLSFQFLDNIQAIIATYSAIITIFYVFSQIKLNKNNSIKSAVETAEKLISLYQDSFKEFEAKIEDRDKKIEELENKLKNKKV